MVISRSQLEATMLRMGASPEAAKAAVDRQIGKMYSQDGDRLTVNAETAAVADDVVESIEAKRDEQAQNN